MYLVFDLADIAIRKHVKLVLAVMQVDCPRVSRHQSNYLPIFQGGNFICTSLGQE